MNYSVPVIRSVEEHPRRRDKGESVTFLWLGQAGFLFRYANLAFMIDPYLSDFLAKKYEGKEFSHKRMMASPIDPKQIKMISYVFCSHAHSDHMDPEALQAIAEINPGCRFIIPASEMETARKRGIPEHQLMGVNAGDMVNLEDCLKLSVIPSAHEIPEKNEKGEHFYLGYIIESGPYCIYHSGDCVPYNGLADTLRQYNIDIAFLPVNGRNRYLADKGIKGNFNFDEPAGLCKETGIPNLVVHHFGMFDFNTVDPDLLTKYAVRYSDKDLFILIPDAGKQYSIEARK